MDSCDGLRVKNPSAMQEMRQEPGVESLGQEDLMEKEIATHSSILMWEISWAEESGDPSPCGCKESYMAEHAQAHRTTSSNLGSPRH